MNIWETLNTTKCPSKRPKDTKKQTTAKLFRTASEGYYPNCDVNVWLRSCEQEIIEPLEGVLKGTIPTWLNGSLLRNGPGSLKVGDMTFNHLFDSSALLHRFSIKNGHVTYQCRFLLTNTYKRNHQAQRIVVTEFGTESVPDPCHSIFQRVSALFKPSETSSDNAMISIYPFGDEYFAFTESPVIFRFDPTTLATEERVDLTHFIGIIHHTSHPHVMEDGSVYNLGLALGPKGPNYVIVHFPRGSDGDRSGKKMFKEAKIVASVPARLRLSPGYMHTFGITEHFFVIVEQPLTVSVPVLFKTKLMNQPMISSLKWFPEKMTYIYLLDRATGELAHKFVAESFFYLHIINQYEKDNHLVLDICCYKDPSMLNCMYIETMQKMHQNPDYARMFRARPLRFVLPLNAAEKSPKRTAKSKNQLTRSSSVSSSLTGSFRSIFSKFSSDSDPQRNLQTSVSFDDFNNNRKPKARSPEIEALLADNLITLSGTRAQAFRLPDKSIFCKPELLCDLGCETPRLNYERNLGREYRYFYAISSDVDADNPGAIIKVDVVKRSRVTWCEENCYPSEPIFIPCPDSKDEDDGIILSAIVWGHDQENRAGLLVLDAKTFKELGRCEFKTPGPVPKCLHGWFAANK